MKTFKNFFGAEQSTKKMSDFSEFAMDFKQMSAIKGGSSVEPIVPDPGKPIPPEDQPL